MSEEEEKYSWDEIEKMFKKNAGTKKKKRGKAKKPSGNRDVPDEPAGEASMEAHGSLLVMILLVVLFYVFEVHVGTQRHQWQKYVINPVIKAVVAKYWGGGVLSPSRMSNRLFQSCFCWLKRKDSNQKENGDNGWMVSAGQVGRIGLLQEGFPVLLRPVLGSDETTNSGKAGILREAEQLIPELLKSAGLGEALDQVNLRSLVGMGPEVLETMSVSASSAVLHDLSENSRAMMKNGKLPGTADQILARSITEWRKQGAVKGHFPEPRPMERFRLENDKPLPQREQSLLKNGVSLPGTRSRPGTSNKALASEPIKQSGSCGLSSASEQPPGGPSRSQSVDLLRSLGFGESPTNLTPIARSLVHAFKTPSPEVPTSRKYTDGTNDNPVDLAAEDDAVDMGAFAAYCKVTSVDAIRALSNNCAKTLTQPLPDGLTPAQAAIIVTNRLGQVAAFQDQLLEYANQPTDPTDLMKEKRKELRTEAATRLMEGKQKKMEAKQQKKKRDVTDPTSSSEAAAATEDVFASYVAADGPLQGGSDKRKTNTPQKKGPHRKKPKEADADAHKEQQNGKAPCVDDLSKMSTEELSEFGERRLVGKHFMDVDSLVATVDGTFQHHELSPGVIAEDVVRKLGIAGEDCKYDDGKIGGRLPEEEWRAIEMMSFEIIDCVVEGDNVVVYRSFGEDNALGEIARGYYIPNEFTAQNEVCDTVEGMFTRKEYLLVKFLEDMDDEDEGQEYPPSDGEMDAFVELQEVQL